MFKFTGPKPISGAFQTVDTQAYRISTATRVAQGVTTDAGEIIESISMIKTKMPEILCSDLLPVPVM